MNYLSKSLILFLLLLTFGCNKVDQLELQSKYLNDKIEDYKEYRWKTCRQEILKEAEARGDSFFVAMAKEQTFDSTKAPRAIQRPAKPEVKIKEDSLPLRPLLNRNTKKDSLRSDSNSIKN